MLENTWKSHLVPFKAKALQQAAIKEMKPSWPVSKSSYKHFTNQIKPLSLP